MNYNVPFQQMITIITSKVTRRFIIKPFCSLYACFILWRCGADIKGSLTVHGFLRVHNEGKLLFGKDIRVNSKSNNYVGIDRRMSVYVGPNGIVEIGDRCALSNSAIVCLKNIKILHDTFIGGGCDIYDSDFHPIETDERIENKGKIPVEEVVIGPKAFIGSHTKILKGVKIGEGSIVGAGSVVTKSVPPYEIWAGVPAKFIRKL